MLTFTVKNFGPLAEGTVELRPLTVFVGGSNTGKSYMAAAIWAAARGIASGNLGFMPGPRGAQAYRRAIRRPRDEDAEAVKAIQDLIELHNGPPNRSSGITVAELPEAAQLMIDKFTRQSLDTIYANIKGRLRDVYGEDSEFAKNGNPADFSLAVCRDNPLLSMIVTLTGHEKPMPAFDVSKAKVPSYELENLPMGFEGRFYENLAGYIFVSAKLMAVESIANGFPPDSYYLPAARSGIAQGHKVLAAALVRQSSRIGIEQFNIPTLPGMATEFLSQLLGLGKRMARRSEFTSQLRTAIDFIENSVLYGKIDLDESGGLPTPEIVYLPGGAELPGAKYTLDHTSSMVSELAPLVLFLKYLVNPGDLLVLEEPESHLHPAAQRELARGIVRLVNAGVKVLVTTHSDTFVSQLNNLLRISYASKRWLRERGFAPEECLNPDDLSVYMFALRDGGDGTEAKKMEISPDFGIDDEWFDEVVKSLYDETVLVQRVRVP